MEEAVDLSSDGLLMNEVLCYVTLIFGVGVGGGGTSCFQFRLGRILLTNVFRGCTLHVLK